MKNKDRASVIVIDDGKILLLYRFKNGKEYYVFPGGGVEEGESAIEAATREAKEETGLDVAISKKMWEYEGRGRLEHFYLVEKFSGELKIGGPEEKRQSPDNVYRLEWTNLDRVGSINLLPEDMKARLLKEFSLR